MAVANLNEPSVAVATLKLAITCDKTWVCNQVCGWVTARDVLAAASAQDGKLCRTAQDILERARGQLPAAGIQAEVCTDRKLNQARRV